MFGLFKKKTHEPVELQREDIDSYPPELARQIINGEDCDELSIGHGDFGSLTNPIPVNGPLGEIKYLAKLRGKSGNALFFHRIGSVNSSVTSNSIDLYEVVCLDGTQWHQLHFSMYHPRRSNNAPKEFSLMPFDKSLGIDLPFAFGVNGFVDNFPFSLPKAIVNFYGESPGLTFARHTQEKLDEFNFHRNKVENNKLKQVLILESYLTVSMTLLSDKLSSPPARAGIQIFILGMADMLRQVENLNWKQFISIYNDILSKYELEPSIPIEYFIEAVGNAASTNTDIEKILRLGAQSINLYITERDANAPTDILGAVVFSEKNASSFTSIN